MALPTIAITGASGLIGSALSASLRADGHQVVRLVRPGHGVASLPDGESVSVWNPAAADGGLDARVFAGAEAVVHLAAPGVADKRWTTARKAELRDSRIRGTRALATGLARLGERGEDRWPGVLLCGSAIGWYGDTGGREVDETTPAGSGFLADLVRDWEAAAQPARDAGIRTVHARSGLVLAPGGGMLGKLVPIFKAGLGTRLGAGTQYMSWISLADEVGAIRFLLGQADVAGPVNLTSPQPVTNAVFTIAMNDALSQPALLHLPVPGLHIPAWAPGVPPPVLRLAVGGVAGELLSSARVLPRRLLGCGYAFQHSGIAAALSYALG
jgi:uncharacterized protein